MSRQETATLPEVSRMIQALETANAMQRQTKIPEGTPPQGAPPRQVGAAAFSSHSGTGQPKPPCPEVPGRPMLLLEPDLVLELTSDKATVRVPGRAAEPVGITLPWRLVLVLCLVQQNGASGQALPILYEWLRGQKALWRRFAALLEGLPEQGHGALLRVSLEPPSPLKSDLLISWWTLERRRWRLLGNDALSPWVLWPWRIRLRLQAGALAIAWRAAVVAVCFTALTGTGLLAPLWDETAYLGGLQYVSRPAPSGTVRMLFMPDPASLPGAEGDVRSDPQVIAQVVIGCLEQGVALVGLDLRLDRDGLPGAPELAQVLRDHAAQVVVGYKPDQGPGQGERIALAARYRAAIEGAMPGQVPPRLSYLGLRYFQRDWTRFRTRAYYQPLGASVRSSVGTGRIPILAAELSQRWTRLHSSPGEETRDLLQEDAFAWLRFPTYTLEQDFWLLPDLRGSTGAEIQALIRRLPLEGKVVLISSWDPGDLHRVPTDDRVRGLEAAYRWPGTMLQAAAFETFEARTSVTPLDMLQASPPWGRSPGLALHGLWLLSWELLLGGWYVVRTRGGRAWMVLTAVSAVLAVGLLQMGQVWVPWASSTLAMACVWYSLARRRLRRRGRGQTGLEAFDDASEA